MTMLPKHSLIHRLVDEARSNLPENLQRKPWTCPSLNHGINLLNDAKGLDSYLAAYGEMHWSKLEFALKQFFEQVPPSDLNKGYELFDWGCGQGLASLAFLDLLSRGQYRRPLPARLTLVEPSDVALARANNFLKTHVADIPQIRLCNRWLPTAEARLDEIDATTVATRFPTAIHLFSNVLDVESIDETDAQ